MIRLLFRGRVELSAGSLQAVLGARIHGTHASTHERPDQGQDSQLPVTEDCHCFIEPRHEKLWS